MDENKKAEITKMDNIVSDFMEGPDNPLDAACVDAMGKAIETVLKDLGVPEDLSPEDTQKMILEKEIQIAEIQTEMMPELPGIYIFQGHKNPVPKAFVSYPFLTKENKIAVRIEAFYKNEEITPAGIILPKNIIGR